MTTSETRMPLAVEAAYRILAERGPLSVVDLREILRSEGFSQKDDRLALLPDRFPRSFCLTREGLLAVAYSVPAATTAVPEDASEDTEWYHPKRFSRVPVGRVAVLDIETTGLDPAADFICELALVGLDGSPLVDVIARLPEGISRSREVVGAELTLAEAMRFLAERIEDVDLVIGHNLLAFDIPFLKAAAKRAGIDAPQLPPCVDSLHLATLVDVTMPNRSMADRTQRYDIVHGETHRALADATAAASVVRALLDEIDANDPAWQLAIGALETFDHPLASLMPPLPAVPELSALAREPDSLLVPSGSPAADAWSATRDAFAVLQTHRGLRPRPAQQEMARAVAEVLDRGGRLAVEAPTGTGKSLAYLLPALGRASRQGKPVVVATATKALQTQLRGEATRLQEEGLLAAPFRQIQGVGNYRLYCYECGSGGVCYASGGVTVWAHGQPLGSKAPIPSYRGACPCARLPYSTVSSSCRRPRSATSRSATRSRYGCARNSG